MTLKEATTVYIQKLIRSDYEERMHADLEKLLQHCPEYKRGNYADENKGFLKLFERFIKKSERKIVWNEIDPMPRGALYNYNDFLVPHHLTVRSLLNKLVVVKLNGGLGTRMKCDSPKSLLPVRNDLTFLDLTVQQIENLNVEFGSNVPLVLMNSFSTVDETEKMLKKYRNLRIKIHTFLQSRYPRITADTFALLPMSYDDPDKHVWYPPGHGDFYESFYKSGLIDKFKEEGKEYCFVSNIDNLGAVVDFRILDMVVKPTMHPRPEFLMEVTQRTPGDVKGGTIINYRGNLKLLEYEEVPKDHVDDFKCTHRFNNFNTNNLWIKLDAIAMLVTQDKLQLDIIENKKHIVRNGCKINIIQLETAAGAAIESFKGAFGLLVPRSRFLPVKSTSDLFLIRSNLYINDNGKLTMNPLRLYPEVPLVNLTDDHFGNYRDLDKRFESIPDCLQLQHLTISGDVYFAKDVSLMGNVTIVANHGGRIDIPRGSIIQYRIITGDLRSVEF